MKLLEKVEAAGYKVTSTKNKYGVRIVTISGDGAWTRIVIKPWADIRLMVGELIARCNRYIANPINL